MAVVQASSLRDEVERMLAGDSVALAERYRIYARLREEAPAFRAGGLVFISRHEDVAWALVHPEIIANGRAAAGEDPERDAVLAAATPDERRMLQVVWQNDLTPVLAGANGPTHRRQRSFVGHGFVPRKVARMTDLVSDLVDDLVGRMPKSEADLEADFASQLPVQVIFTLLGVDAAHRAEIWRLVMRMSLAVGHVDLRGPGLREAYETTVRFKAFIGEVIASHRARGAGVDDGDMLDAFMAADGNDALSDDEIFALVRLLLYAGSGTTAHMIAAAARQALLDREIWKRLPEDPELADAVVEESMRRDCPAQEVLRHAAVDFELHGLTIRRGENVRLLIAAANRDPEVFADPDTFRLGREISKVSNLAFGLGIHYCIGAPVARLEGRLALCRLAAAFPKMILTATAMPMKPTFHYWAPESILVRPLG